MNKQECGAFYDFINTFDVFGTPEDGWEVNNQCVEYRNLFLADDTTPKQIAQFLVNLGFLNTADMRRIVIEDEGEFIFVYQKKDMFPLGYFVQRRD